MIRLLSISALALLAGCGGATFGIQDPGTNNDPSTDPREIYVGNDDDLNNLSYDAVNDELTINNLPFDGVDGVYVNAGLDPGSIIIPGFQIYRSQTIGESGALQYFAIYGQGNNGFAAAAGTGDYADFGHGGAVIGRDSNTVLLPVGQGELIYTGDYAGIRVYTPGDLTFSTGDATLYVDLLDFDVTGAVLGGITNRREIDQTGADIGALQDIVLNESTNITTDGQILDGTVSVWEFVGGVPQEVRDGTYQAIFTGPDGQEIVGTLIFTGPAVHGSDIDVQETGTFIVVN